MKNGSYIKAIILFIVGAGCLAAFVVIDSFMRWPWLAAAVLLFILSLVQVSRRKAYKNMLENSITSVKRLDPVYIDLDKEVKKALYDSNRICKVIAENNEHALYAFVANKTNSAYYGLLRRSKSNPNEIVYLGALREMPIVCLFDNSLFYQEQTTIYSIDIGTGETKHYKWLNKQYQYKPVINGLSWCSEDIVSSLYANNNEMNGTVNRSIVLTYDLDELNPEHRSFSEAIREPGIHYNFRQDYLDRVNRPDIDVSAVQRAISSGKSIVEGRFNLTLNPGNNAYCDATIRDNKTGMVYNRRIEVEKSVELMHYVEMYLVAFLCNLKQGRRDFEKINLLGDNTGIVVIRNYDSEYRFEVCHEGDDYRITYYYKQEDNGNASDSTATTESDKTLRENRASNNAPMQPTTKRGLGRDESKHIKCDYEGREGDCPKDCDKCAIGIKTDGDTALAMGNFEEAIRQYKRAIFVEPRLSDAWCNLGNAYGMNSEYEKAIEAFDKAIEIDPKYGKALFGKAISLRNAGRPEEALALANKILEMYDDKQVEQFKNGLIGNGARKQKGTLSAQEAIDILTAKGMDIARNRNLLADDGKIHTIKALDTDETFATDVYRYCKRSLSSFGLAKVNSESVVMAFYGGLYSTLAYFEAPEELTGVPVFAYLKDHVDLEKLEQAAETKLGIRGNEAESEKVWNVIYPYARYTCDITERVSPSSDAEKAVIDAADSAFILGMQLAMRKTV